MKEILKVKVVINEKFDLQSIMRSWGPTHPGSFQLSRSQYYSVLITFQPCDQKIITVCQDDHPDMFRSLCCSIEEEDEEEEKGPMRATAYTVSDTVLSQVSYI